MARHETEIQWVEKSNLTRSRFIDWWQWVELFIRMERNRLSRNLVRGAASSWAGNNVWLPKGKQQLPSRNFINQQCRRIPSLMQLVCVRSSFCLRIGLQCKYFCSQHQRANRDRRQRKYLPCDMTMLRVVAASLISRIDVDFQPARQSISKRH